MHKISYFKFPENTKFGRSDIFQLTRYDMTFSWQLRGISC